MLDIYWCKFFDNGNVECLCLDGRKKCVSKQKPSCKKYLLKFIPYNEHQERVELKNFEDVIKNLTRKIS